MRPLRRSLPGDERAGGRHEGHQHGGQGADLASDRASIAFFETLPVNDRARVDFSDVRGVQFLQPLFEFSGACAGCGETPYLKLLSQLFGDRLQIANATGCSSIYGANLPVTPWTKNAEGRGPAWSNSLFEDNAEFGLGFRLAADKHLEIAHMQLAALAPIIGAELANAITHAPQIRESDIRAQRIRVAQLKTRLLALQDDPAALGLLSVVDSLVRRSIWIVGGDGWAYDIGYGGLDHVLATGRDVNVLVLDTEVYSNTGGQASKATPLGAIAKFAASGKRTPTQGSRFADDRLWQRVCRPGGDGRQPAAYAAGVPRGRGVSRPIDHPGLQPVHRPWNRHAPGHEAAGSRYRQRLLAAVPLQPGNAHDRRKSIPPRQPDGRAFSLKSYAYNELRYRALATTRPAEANAVMAEAQAAVTGQVSPVRRTRWLRRDPLPA